MRLLSLLVAALAVSAWASRAAAGAPPPCGPSKARTIEQSDQARAYRAADELYVCSARSRRTYRLGRASSCGDGSGGECGGVRQVHVAGRYVSFVDHQAGGSLRDAYFTLRIRDTVTGRIPYRFRQGRIARTQAYLERLVLDRNSNAAWITTLGDYTDGPTTVEVRRSSGCGAAILDRGLQISRTLLRLSSGRLTWRHAGGLRTARLCSSR